MLTKNEIKFLKSLHLKKERENAQLFLAEGEKLVQEALQSEYTVKEVFTQNNLQLKIPSKVPVREISESEMKQISGLSTPPGIIAVIHYPKPFNVNFNDLVSQPFLIIDRMNDPGNLGTVIRTADWFGIKSVFCSENTVDRFNSKTVQSSMGSIFRVEIQYLNLIEFITHLQEKNIPVFAAAMNGKEAKNGFLKNGGLILGSESHGIDPEILKLNPQLITIPKKGGAESLNVGVAAGILMSMMGE